MVTIDGVEMMFVFASPRSAFKIAAQLVPESRMRPTAAVMPCGSDVAEGVEPAFAAPSVAIPGTVEPKSVNADAVVARWSRRAPR